MKVKKKGKLKATFIDAAQIVRNILVLEPYNKHRIKREIFERKKAGEYIERYDWGLSGGQERTTLAIAASGIPVIFVGGILAITVAPAFFVASLPIAMSCLIAGQVSMLKWMHLDSGNVAARVTRRFERQAERKLKRLQKAQRKRVNQLLTSDI